MRLGFRAAMIGVALAGGPVAAAEVTVLPDGPDRELVLKTCQSCHDLQMVFDVAGSTRAEWTGTLDEMVDHGLSVSRDDRARILDYLATYLGPTPPKAKP
jgi:hypothetical protein